MEKKESFTVSAEFNATPARVYQAWLNSQHHSEMTGGEANCNANVGDSFSAWDGYITGTNVELVENEKIIQTWRTTEFEIEQENSVIELLFTSLNNRCKVTLNHSHLPKGQTQYKQGWEDHYFAPMQEYFG